MSVTTIASTSCLSRLKLFMALSRTPHGLLDMATPALGAVLYLGGVPSFPVILLGFLTAFAGYTAVYALNDVVDYRVDKQKMEQCGLRCRPHDLDAVYVRHPLAQGLLGLRESLLWTAAWGGVALVGAYALNPLCALVFVAGCVAEAVYCLMLRVSALRVLVSGGVKTAGGLAAVFAVSGSPSVLFLVLFFLWLFVWEIGGQNVPNDWSDVQEDADLEAETIPVRFGTAGTARIIMWSLGAAVGLSLLLYWAAPVRLSPFYLIGALTAGGLLLIVPGWRLFQSRTPRDASFLFNRASYYPLAMLGVVLISAWL